MIIVYGEANYGEVDRVPGLFSVVTRFFHLYGFPVAPLGSYLVLEGSRWSRAFGDTPISLSFRSMLTAWLRGISILTIPVSLIGSLAGYVRFSLQGGGPSLLLTWGGVFLAAITTLMLSYFYFRKASLRRALELADILGVDPQEVKDGLRGRGRRARALDQFLDDNPQALGKFDPPASPQADAEKVTEHSAPSPPVDASDRYAPRAEPERGAEQIAPSPSGVPFVPPALRAEPEKEPEPSAPLPSVVPTTLPEVRPLSVEGGRYLVACPSC